LIGWQENQYKGNMAGLDVLVAPFSLPMQKRVSANTHFPTSWMNVFPVSPSQVFKPVLSRVHEGHFRRHSAIFRSCA
jgi:hypothetical protein